MHFSLSSNHWSFFWYINGGNYEIKSYSNDDYQLFSLDRGQLGCV